MIIWLSKSVFFVCLSLSWLPPMNWASKEGFLSFSNVFLWPSFLITIGHGSLSPFPSPVSPSEHPESTSRAWFDSGEEQKNLTERKRGSTGRLSSLSRGWPLREQLHTANGYAVGERAGSATASVSVMCILRGAVWYLRRSYL